MSTELKEAARSYILEGSSKVKKWQKVLTEVDHQLQASSRDALSLETKTALAKLLENTQSRINYELRESTQNYMVGPYKRYAMDIIAGLIPNLIATDIVSLQPLENKQGIINFVEFNAGSTKGQDKKGDRISNTFLYEGLTENYTASKIDAQIIKSDASGNLALDWTPVLPGSITIETSAGAKFTDKVAKLDAEGGDIYDESGAVVGSIVYATGAVTFTSSSTIGAEVEVSATYDFNNQYAPVEVPQLDMRINSELLIARSRKLKALWSFDAQYELQKEYGQDIGALLAAQAAGEIAHKSFVA